MPDFFTDEIIHKATPDERLPAMQVLNSVYWPGIMVDKGETLMLVKRVPARLRPGQKTDCLCQDCGRPCTGEFNGTFWRIEPHTCKCVSGNPTNQTLPDAKKA